MRSTSSPHSPGFTLLEVLAALVVLGTLMTGAMLAKSRYARQTALAERKLEAIRSVDDLLQGWWGEHPDVPQAGHGTLAGGAMTWQTRTQAIDKYRKITRLDVFDSPRRSGDEPLVSVELLMAREPNVEKRS